MLEKCSLSVLEQRYVSTVLDEYLYALNFDNDQAEANTIELKVNLKIHHVRK